MARQLPSRSPCSHLLPAQTHIGGRILTLHPSQHALTPPASVRWRLLYLIGLQFVRVAGQPLHQVAGDHVARATGERRVGWTGVLQLLPLSNAIHCPALPETGSGQQGHHHHHTLSVLSSSLTHHCFDRAFRLLSDEFTCAAVRPLTAVESKTYVMDSAPYLLSPPEIAPPESLLVNLH